MPDAAPVINMVADVTLALPIWMAKLA